MSKEYFVSLKELNEMRARTREEIGRRLKEGMKPNQEYTASDLADMADGLGSARHIANSICYDREGYHSYGENCDYLRVVAPMTVSSRSVKKTFCEVRPDGSINYNNKITVVREQNVYKRK